MEGEKRCISPLISVIAHKVAGQRERASLKKLENSALRDCQSAAYSWSEYSMGTTMSEYHHVFCGAQVLWSIYSEIALQSPRSFSPFSMRRLTSEGVIL